MKDTKISWAHATINFWIGCNYVSAECEGCYANALSKRMGRNFTTLERTGTWGDAYELEAEAVRKGGPMIVFTCSLSDFFHVQADKWRESVWRVLRETPHLRWLILTKRPERIRECLPADWGEQGYENVWIGTTVGTRESYGRLDVLQSIPCALRFVSAEPLLEDISDIDLTGIDWVAVGGMSGPLHKEKGMELQWAASLYKRCQDAGVPFLFKQSSAIHTERGIDGLSRYLDGTSEVIREYPVTEPPLLPFTEHGKRYTDDEWSKLVQITPAVQVEEENKPAA